MAHREGVTWPRSTEHSPSRAGNKQLRLVHCADSVAAARYRHRSGTAAPDEGPWTRGHRQGDPGRGATDKGTLDERGCASTLRLWELILIPYNFPVS